MNLSAENFDRAALFVNTHARPIDRCLFAYHFNAGSAGDVLDALRAFQNPDGGFGNALEPDFRLPASSAMATSVGLQYAVAVGTPPEHPIVQGAIQYLVNTYQAEGDYWPALPLEVNDHPHAFWWGRDSVAAPPEEAWANPSAELVGYLHYARASVPADLLACATARARKNLESGVAFSEGELSFYQLLNWERAIPFLPEGVAKDARDRILTAYRSLRPLTQEKLSELKVYMIAPSPDSLAALALPEIIEPMLENEIGNQAEDGAWWPGWHWGQYDDVWEVAKKEWAGRITVDCLLTLKNFGKL